VAKFLHHILSARDLGTAAKKTLGLRSDQDAKGPWYGTAGLQQSSKFNAVLTNTLTNTCTPHRTFLGQGNFRRCNPESHDLVAAEFDEEEQGVYGPLWKFLWHFGFSELTGFQPVFKQSSVKPWDAEIKGWKILNDNVLAYFDSVVTIAAWGSTHITAAEASSSVTSEVADLKEEHGTPLAKLAVVQAIKDAKLMFAGIASID